jgi:hypothetical protein
MALVSGSHQPLSRAPGLRRIVFPELLDNDLVESQMEPGIDFLAVDDHELLVAVECIRALGVLGLYQDATLVAIGRIEQSKIDLAENPPSPNMSVERNAFGLRLPPKRAGFAGRMEAAGIEPASADAPV